MSESDTTKELERLAASVGWGYEYDPSKDCPHILDMGHKRREIRSAERVRDWVRGAIKNGASDGKVTGLGKYI